MLPKPMLRMQRVVVLLLTAILVGMVIHPIQQIDSPLSEDLDSSSSSPKAGSTDWTAVAGYDTVTTPSIQVEAGLVSPTDVAIDSLGSVYTGGFAIYDVKFGGQQYSATNQLAFVAKTSPSGNWEKLWSPSVFGGGGSATVSALTTSGTDVYACGWFVGNVTIAGQNLQSYTPPGSVESSQDIWVAKFDQNLNAQWASHAGTVQDDDACEDILVSPNSNDVYIIGETNATSSSYFGTSITKNGIGGTSTDIAVAKLNSVNGNWIDANVVGSTGQDLGYSIYWRGGGMVAVGIFSGTITLGSQQMQAIGSFDLWMADITTGLGFVNASQAGGTGGIAQPFAVVHQNGVDYVAGTVQGTVNFDTNQVMSSSNGQDTTTFVASRSGANNQWDWITTASGYHQVRDLDINPSGVLLVSGSYGTVSWTGTGGSLAQSGSATFGTVTLPSTYFDPFYATMDSSGNWISADGGAGDFNDNGVAGMWAPTGEIIGVGTFGSGGPTNIGSTYTITLGSGTAIGNGNAFTDQNYQIYQNIGYYIWSLKADSDSDGTPDVDDNCPNQFNPSQSDIDSDGLGDECDPDADQDGLLNEEDNCPNGPEVNWDPTDNSINRDQDGCKDSTEDTDDDADGIDDFSDLCDDIGDKMGWISNSVRDHDSDGCHDAEEDDDDDNDAIPDAVDDCPRGWFNWSASTTTDHDTDGCADNGEDDDDDNDGMNDYDFDDLPLDQCPKGDLGWTSSPTTDRDGDGCRDEGEDTDDDGDTILDVNDNCTPDGDLDWTSALPNDHDGDGCRDATEDDDDDNDGVLDSADSCPTGMTGWTSSPLLDVDGDGCMDSDEDNDNDNDGVLNEADLCPGGETGWFASNDLDADGDGCKDSTEDTDDDADGVEDQFDVCPDTPLGEAVDNVGCGYNTQQDNDQDGIYDINDACLNSPSSADRILYETLVSEANGLIHQWGTNIDVSGCWLGELDRDNDNRKNYLDQCPDSPSNAIVDEFGCSMAEYDWDKDGVVGDLVQAPDACPSTSSEEIRMNYTSFGSVDGIGCWSGDSDQDQDSILAYLDMCPGTEYGLQVNDDDQDLMGCADNQLDFDNDNIMNDADVCPDTPANTEVQSEGERMGCTLEQRLALGDFDAQMEAYGLFVGLGAIVIIALLGAIGFFLLKSDDNIGAIPPMPMKLRGEMQTLAPVQAPPGFAPSQPAYVADYTGLPGGGHYDQGYDGSTIYIAPDATQWKMNSDGSFNRI
tara:strand:- start:11895 stop:15590 length:3696 start_codon:yes stop_codon:yes gene_type:complete